MQHRRHLVMDFLWCDVPGDDWRCLVRSSRASDRSRAEFGGVQQWILAEGGTERGRHAMGVRHNRGHQGQHEPVVWPSGLRLPCRWKLLPAAAPDGSCSCSTAVRRKCSQCDIMTQAIRFRSQTRSIAAARFLQALAARQTWQLSNRICEQVRRARSCGPRNWQRKIKSIV